jgi:hypothetical protein
MKTAFLGALLLGLGALTAGCTAKPKGEVILAIQTDLSLPKDIDRIRVEVLYVDSGAFAFQQDFEKIGDDGSIKLPATIGFTAPEDPARAIKIRVIATRGSDAGVRVLREIVTTVPVDRTATLPVLIQFLCDGSGEPERDAAGNVKRDASDKVIVKSACPDGLTCISGACQDAKLDPGTFADYVPAAIFGGGTGEGDGQCFDVAACFDGASRVALDLETFQKPGSTPVCQAKMGGDRNLAIETQGAGICTKTRCFVALDAESDTGWKSGPDGTIVLPARVCELALSGEIVGLASAALDTAACPKKDPSLPTCGPWSSAGKSTPLAAKEPVVIASGQVNPLALALTADQVFWIDRGTFDATGKPRSDGSVKATSISGGQPHTLATAQASPHDVALDAATRFVYWTNASGGQLMAAAFDAPKAIALLDKLAQPEGLALDDHALYWTDLITGEVRGGTLSISKSTPTLKPDIDALPAAPTGTSPRRIAAAGKDLVCWTYEGKLATATGVVACKDSMQTVVIAKDQRTPRAIAVDGQGASAVVYFASFDAAGGIYKVARTAVGFDAPEAITPGGEAFPNGLAVDKGSVYWTSRSEGTVKRFAGGVIETLATGQNNPGAIAVKSGVVYWIDEGTPDQPDGAIMKLTP